MRVIYRIDAGFASPRDARRIIARELGRFVSAARLDDLKLLISELVTGRVPSDGHDPPASGLVLDFHAEDVIRCSVRDTGPAQFPNRLSAGILDLLSDRWGMTTRGDTTQLWFEAGLGS